MDPEYANDIENSSVVCFPGFEPDDYMCVFQAVFNLFLFDTKQIPLPFTELKAANRRILKQKKLENGRENPKLSRFDQNLSSFVQSVELLFNRLTDFFSTYQVSRVVILTGSTPFNPKQSIVLVLPTNYFLTTGGPENLGCENCANFCVQKVHRFYFSKKFLSIFKG